MLKRPQHGLLTSAAYSSAARLGAAGFSLGNVLIISRALGPTGRGQTAFLITIVLLSSQVAGISVSESISNIAGSEPQRRAALATNAGLISGALGMLAALVLAGLFLTFPGIGPRGLGSLWLLSLASIPLLILLDYLTRLVLADYRFRVANASWVIPPLINVSANGLLFLEGDLTVWNAFSVWLAGQMFALALVAACVSRRQAGFGHPNVALARRMLSFGLKSHGSRLLMWGNYRFDQWLVGALAGSRQLGLYSVAVSWAEAAFLIPQAVAYVQRPDLVRAGREAAARQAARAFRIVTIATVPLAAGLVLAAPVLCVTFFGPRFQGSIEPLRILALGAFGIVATKVLGNALIAQGRPLLETAGSMTAFAAAMVLDLVLVPDAGGTGAAVASSIAYAIGGLTMIGVACGALGIRTGELVPRLSANTAADF